jgi:hypothetical protein
VLGCRWNPFVPERIASAAASGTVHAVHGGRARLAAMRDAEIEALGAVAAAYERWTEASTRLEEQMSAAAAQEAAPPVDALRMTSAPSLR